MSSPAGITRTTSKRSLATLLGGGGREKSEKELGYKVDIKEKDKDEQQPKSVSEDKPAFPGIRLRIVNEPVPAVSSVAATSSPVSSTNSSQSSLKHSTSEADFQKPESGGRKTESPPIASPIKKAEMKERDKEKDKDKKKLKPVKSSTLGFANSSAAMQIAKDSAKDSSTSSSLTQPNSLGSDAFPGVRMHHVSSPTASPPNSPPVSPRANGKETATPNAGGTTSPSSIRRAMSMDENDQQAPSEGTKEKRRLMSVRQISSLFSKQTVASELNDSDTKPSKSKKEDPYEVTVTADLLAVHRGEPHKGAFAFGKPLDELKSAAEVPPAIVSSLFSTNADLNQVPLALFVLMEELGRRGLSTTGLFRLSARTQEVLDLKQLVDTTAPDALRALNLEHHDIHSVASVVKLLFREMPEPLLPNPFKSSTTLAELDERIPKTKALITSLSVKAKATFYYLFDLLRRITDEKHLKMTANNLGIVFGPTVMKINETDLNQFHQSSAVVEFLIDHYTALLPERRKSPRAGSRPQPVDPAVAADAVSSVGGSVATSLSGPLSTNSRKASSPARPSGNSSASASPPVSQRQIPSTPAAGTSSTLGANAPSAPIPQSASQGSSTSGNSVPAIVTVPATPTGHHRRTSSTGSGSVFAVARAFNSPLMSRTGSSSGTTMRNSSSGSNSTAITSSATTAKSDTTTSPSNLTPPTSSRPLTAPPSSASSLPSSTPVAQWSCEEVKTWVDEMKVAPEYGANFLRHRIDGAALLELDKSDLVDMGVNLIGHQKTILRNIRTLSQQTGKQQK